MNDLEILEQEMEETPNLEDIAYYCWCGQQTPPITVDNLDDLYYGLVRGLGKYSSENYEALFDELRMSVEAVFDFDTWLISNDRNAQKQIIRDTYELEHRLTLEERVVDIRNRLSIQADVQRDKDKLNKDRITPGTSDEFNEKWAEFIEEGHYGNTIENIEALKYLDEEFKALTLINGFKFSQIKSKFGSYCFYADNTSEGKLHEIELRLKEICG